MGNDPQNMKDKVFSGLFWKFGERIAAQLVTFIVSIVLARLLTPSDYGSIALITIFITIANVFVINGFGSALIQKKDADNLDFSSVFYFNIFFSLFIYMILFFASPYIANFYGDPILSPVLRVLSFLIPISAINNVQQCYVSRHMLFQRFFWSTLFGTLLSGVVGIIMAYKNYGIWALVAQYLMNTIVDTIILWYTVKWRPIRAFSAQRMKQLFSYGWKLLCASLLDTGYTQIRSLIIGRMYSSEQLAFYNYGEKYPSLIVLNINSSIISVLFPAISSYQDDKTRVKAITRRAIKTSSYIMWPMLIGLCVVAKPLIRLMLTDKWLPCVPYLQITCLAYGFWPINTANLEAVKAVGRSDLFLKLEVIKKIIGMIVLIAIMRFGVMAITWSLVGMSIISCFINAYPNRTLLEYGYLEQIRDMLPAFGLACGMGLLIYPIHFLEVTPWLTLILQVFSGGIVYIIGSKVFHLESYHYILEIIQSKRRNRKN